MSKETYDDDPFIVLTETKFRLQCLQKALRAVSRMLGVPFPLLFRPDERGTG